MKVAFAGTPEFAVPTLKAIIASRHPVVLVVTQPDRPVGRSGRPMPPPVKQVAVARGVPLIQPESINRPDALARLREAEPDVLLVVAYGKILTRRVIDFAPHGTINIHASLLPKYRGAAPIVHAILNGEHETGVTLQRVAKRLDTGPVLVQRTLKIRPEEDAGQLAARLSALAAELIVPALDDLEERRLTDQPQDESKVTYAPKLSKSDGLIPWERDAAAVHNLIRAMTPWPGAYTFRHPAGGGKAQRLIVLSARVEECPGAPETKPCEGSSNPSQGSLRAGQPCEGLDEPSQGEVAPGTILGACNADYPLSRLGAVSDAERQVRVPRHGRGEGSAEGTHDDRGLENPRYTLSPLVACGRGCLRLLQVKPEGSRPMEAAAWLRGCTVQPGDQFRGET